MKTVIATATATFALALAFATAAFASSDQGRPLVLQNQTAVEAVQVLPFQGTGDIKPNISPAIGDPSEAGKPAVLQQR